MLHHLVSCFFAEHSLAIGLSEVRGRRDGGMLVLMTQLGVLHSCAK